jgi:uncharacterized membrane protein YjfL (UPF0719 family)
MNLTQILLGILELLVTVLISFVLIFISYRIILVLTRKFDDEEQLKKRNLSAGIVLGGIFVGEAVVVKSAVYPAMAVFQLYATGESRGFLSLLKALALSLGFILMTGLLAVAVIFFCFWLFNRLTPRINQYEEILADNRAVAVLMALFIVALCILMSSGVSGLTKALIPFPDVGSIPLG